jgi:hypothetical protein
MTSPLPDDINEWPQNPYELLGVEANAPQDVIKRAYSRLIRRFKPDQFPVQFERIRAAYDSVKAGSGHNVFFPGVNQAFRPVPFTAVRSSTPTPKPAEKSRKLTEQWQSVSNGDAKQAYQNLIDLNREDPGDEPVYLRLFWLCALYPQVDRDRRPAQWLLAGLRQAQSVTDLMQLWELELRYSPIDAVGDEMLAIIGSNLRAGLTFEPLRARWEAAWLLGRSRTGGTQNVTHDTIVVSDVAALRSTSLAEDTRLWIEVLSQAAERLVWSPVEANRIESGKYVDEIDHLTQAGDFRWSLGRLDAALAAAHEWHRIEGRYGEWLRPICAAWLCSASEAESVARRMLCELAADPEVALYRLDHARQHAPVLLWRLDEMAAELAVGDGDAADRTDDAVNTTIGQYLQRTGPITYADWRRPLLEFLLAECIQPAQVAAAIEYGTSKNSSARQAANKLREDVALRCLCRAHQALWRTG